MNFIWCGPDYLGERGCNEQNTRDLRKGTYFLI